MIALTGVSRGIGLALLRRYLEDGHRVHALGRSAPAWAFDHGDRFALHCCDFSEPAGVVAACREIVEPIDTLICSAADFGGDAFHLNAFSVEAFSRAFVTNCISPVLMARELRERLAAGQRRHMIFLSTGNASLSGNREGGMLAYRTSKSALNQAVRNLAAEWGGEGFVAVALNPGWVRTDMGGPNAPMESHEVASEIANFCEAMCSAEFNGRFCNTDGSDLPW